MDKLFPLDDDIIGSEESDAYKSFQLVDQWRVSPPNTGHFSLTSPELTFPASTDYLEKMNVPCEIEKDNIEVKQEVKEEVTSPVHWLSVLANKQHCPWKENVDNSFEERYLTEQVVPDQVSAMDFADKKDDVLETRHEAETFEFSKSQSAENVFIDLKNPSMNAVNSSLETGVISENLSNSQFSPDHKEQVKGSGENGFVLAPVVDMFTYDTLCKNEHLEQAAQNNEISDFGKLKIEEKLSNGSKQTIEQEQSPSNGELEDIHLVTSNNSSDSSRPEEIINYANLEVKLEREEKQLCITKDLSQNPSGSDKVYKKLMKFLIPKRIPKCMMVEYEFDSNEKLPSFKDIFCPEHLNAAERPNIELPDVLKSEETDNNDDEEDNYIVLSDTDSEHECMDVENNETEPVALNEIDSSLLDNVKSVELQTVAPNDGHELTSEFHSKAQSKDLHNVHEPTSNILTLDDELENFLVSNMVLAGDQNGGSAQLPDLSDNLGCILRNDNEDNPLDSIYRNLFPRNGYPVEADSMWYKTPRGDQSKLQLQGYDGYGSFVNPTGLLCSGERTWQEHINRENLNAVYGNVWTRNATTEAYLHQLGARHFTNNRIFHATEPFLHGVSKPVPSDAIQTEIDGFKFSHSAARVEVVDSSLNYEF